MPTRAVLFDLDETLVADGAATQAALRAAATFAAQRQPAAPEDLPEAEALARAAWLRALDGWEHSPHQDYFQAFGISAGECLWGRFIGEDARLRPIARWAIDFQFQTWLRALADLGQPDDAQTEALAALLAERFRMERRARHTWLFPEVRATLDALCATYGTHALALITNGAPDIQRDKLVGSGLEPNFPVVVVSCEAGVAKPDPAIFAQALAALEVAPGDAVMVGDSSSADILGANRAGVRAIWIRRTDQSLAPGAHPDATIASLAELPALL